MRVAASAFSAAPSCFEDASSALAHWPLLFPPVRYPFEVVQVFV